MTRNIALFGHMASGKSSIANALVNAGFIQLAFAEPLKNVAALAYGKVDKTGEYEVTSMDGEQALISGREVLQRVGQSIKTHDRDFWLRCFFRTAQNYLDNRLVVDDGRFVFEMEALMDQGWLVVGVDTPIDVRLDRYKSVYGRLPTPAELHHESEMELPEIIKRADLVVRGTDPPAGNVYRILRVAGELDG